MNISSGQLLARYRYLFPVGCSMDTVKHLVNTFKTMNLDTRKVAFVSNEFNYRPVLLAMHIYSIEKESKLIKADLLQAHDIVSAFFGANDEFRYPSLNGINVQYLSVVLGFAEPNPKKSVELVKYIMYKYETDNHNMWLFCKKGNDILKDCTDLRYTIISVDDLTNLKVNKTNSKPSKTITTQYDDDLF